MRPNNLHKHLYVSQSLNLVKLQVLPFLLSPGETDCNSIKKSPFLKLMVKIRRTVLFFYTIISLHFPRFCNFIYSPSVSLIPFYSKQKRQNHQSQPNNGTSKHEFEFLMSKTLFVWPGEMVPIFHDLWFCWSAVTDGKRQRNPMECDARSVTFADKLSANTNEFGCDFPLAGYSPYKLPAYSLVLASTYAPVPMNFFWIHIFRVYTREKPRTIVNSEIVCALFFWSQQSFRSQPVLNESFLF